MKTRSVTQFNEKPSKHRNIGEDIGGAKRHNFDTYESDDTKKEKERMKKAKQHKSSLKKIAVESLNEANFKSVILNYEFQSALENFPSYDGPKEYSKDSVLLLRGLVLTLKNSANYGSLVRKYNRMSRLTGRLDRRLTWDVAKDYFSKKCKNSFIETNGIKRPWLLETSFNPDSIAHLSAITKAVQFGNSIPDSEREYCLMNLSESLRIFSKYFSFDFKNVGFSFGARGKAGSIAHYQDSAKVIAVNRSWDGALIHEIGHAIDYSLGRVSRNMPFEIRSKYRAKLAQNKVSNQSYYMKDVEIFARLFEVFFKSVVPETTSYMQTTFNPSVMPDLDAASIEFMSQSLKSIMKGSL